MKQGFVETQKRQKSIMKKSLNIDEYIKNYPEEIQQRLQQIMAIIKKIAPRAEEVISYGIPAFKLNGLLVWFAAYTKHIGFYPKASGIEAFKKELSVFKGVKGSVQFPFDKALPMGLITKIIKFS